MDTDTVSNWSSSGKMAIKSTKIAKITIFHKQMEKALRETPAFLV